MQVKGNKPAEERSAKLMREHPLMGDNADAYLDELKTVPELRHAVKVLARTVRLLVENKI